MSIKPHAPELPLVLSSEIERRWRQPGDACRYTARHYSMAWDDFSKFVTHFTKPTPPRSEYDNQLAICSSRRLEAQNPFGIARRTAPDAATQKTVCFSEVPLHQLDRIADRRSRYGIGFTKEFAKTLGTQPIWYVEKDGAQHAAINDLMARAHRSPSPVVEPIWQLTPFIDVPGD